MKSISKLAVLLSMGAALTVAASAKTIEQAYVESYSKTTTGPVPVSVVTPRLSADYVGDKVELEFVVDATGKPTQFSVKSSPDVALTDAVLDAVKKWEFKPATRNGVPEATKVLLPIVVVDESSTGVRYASN